MPICITDSHFTDNTMPNVLSNDKKTNSSTGALLAEKVICPLIYYKYIKEYNLPLSVSVLLNNRLPVSE
jgi:hypothetical protein